MKDEGGRMKVKAAVFHFIVHRFDFIVFERERAGSRSRLAGTSEV
jgi:hypothetical protein